MTKLDQFHYHEFTDRVDCVIAMLDKLVYEHPVFKSHKPLDDAMENASDALGYLYTLAAELEEKNT